MSYFFFAVLLAGLFPALWLALAPPSAEKQRVTLAILCGLLLGGIFGHVYPVGQIPLLAWHGYRLLLPGLFLIVLWFRPSSGHTFFTFALACMSSFWFIRDPNIQNFTATAVINSALLLNIGTVLAGIMIIALLFLSSARLSNHLSLWRWPLMLVLYVTYVLPLSGDILLSMIKLEILPLDSVLLSYIARVTYIQNVIPFVAMACLTGLGMGSVFLWLKPLKKSWDTASDGNPQRKAKAAYLLARRWCISHGVLIVLALLPALYWQFIASQPPVISAATSVQIASDDKVHIPVASIRDGNLHRFAWIADDGKVVRFIVINRFPQQLKLGVAFDACLLCGDQGYIQEGNQIICVACGVHIFIPSIGKAGGCNPVPLEHWSLVGQGEQQELLISRQELESGTTYFNAIAEKQVTDPVSKETLSNTSAKYKYTLDDHTYFFTSEAHMESFRDNPEHYLKELN